MFTILAGPGDDLGNGWERADIGEDRIGLFDREQGNVYLLQPPKLPYTSGVIALDGTPTSEMWQIVLGERLNHRQILTNDECRECITDVLNHSYVVTTQAVKPHNSPDHVSVQQDTVLFEAIEEKYGQQPGLITTATAEMRYENDEEFSPLDHVDESKHYGNVLGSNELSEKRYKRLIFSFPASVAAREPR